MAHGDAREGKWRGKWWMDWVASTLHTTSEHGVSSITTADAHTSAASSRLNWRPRLFKWTRTFRRKTKSGFCACAITFQLASNTPWQWTSENRNMTHVRVGGHCNTIITLIQLCTLVGLNCNKLTVMHGMENVKLVPASLIYSSQITRTFR